MKFFFTKTDSLYKIFKALEKIPSHRDIEIFIDPEHSLFDNERRGYQIKEILEKNNINATFIAKNKRNRDYLTSVGLKVNYEKERDFKKALNIFYLFFFNIKKFHLHAYETKKYIFVLIFLLELFLILGILRFIISLIIPSVNITIYPSEERESIIYNVRYYPVNDQKSNTENRFLHVPFYEGNLEYKYDLTSSSENIKYITNPSYGKIKIYNTKDSELSFLKGTQFITSNGLLFSSEDSFKIPAGTEDSPSETIITIKADEYDQYDQIMGVRGNIQSKTQLFIKNLDTSFYEKAIRAESIEDFVGGKTSSEGSITDKDIQLLKGKLTQEVYDKKISIVSENFPVSGGFLLPFDSLITTTFNDIVIEDTDNPAIVKGSAYVTYNYKYVMRDDLYKIFMTYVNERSSEDSLLVKIDPDSIQFLKNSITTSSEEVKKSDDTYSISTQIDIVQTYDFANDPKNIISDIKNKIAGVTLDEARDLILSSYEEIGSIKMSTPLRYNTIPLVKSRINISYE